MGVVVYSIPEFITFQVIVLFLYIYNFEVLFSVLSFFVHYSPFFNISAHHYYPFFLNLLAFFSSSIHHSLQCLAFVLQVLLFFFLFCQPNQDPFYNSLHVVCLVSGIYGLNLERCFFFLVLVIGLFFDRYNFNNIKAIAFINQVRSY